VLGGCAAMVVGRILFRLPNERGKKTRMPDSTNSWMFA